LSYSAGDILYVKFPFEDLPVTKARPALFWTYTEEGEMLLLSRITTKEHDDGYDIPIEPNEFNGLREKSCIRVNKLAKITENNVISLLGSLNEIQIAIVKEKLDEYLATLQ